VHLVAAFAHVKSRNFTASSAQRDALCLIIQPDCLRARKPGAAQNKAAKSQLRWGARLKQKRTTT
jgi:hypothetical protein